MKNTFTLAHVGVNTENAEEALALAELLAGMFNLAPRHGQKSEFAGPYFECMKAPFHGKNGHIAMQTPDLESAVAELKEKGFSFREGDRGARRRRGSSKTFISPGNTAASPSTSSGADDNFFIKATKASSARMALSLCSAVRQENAFAFFR